MYRKLILSCIAGFLTAQAIAQTGSISGVVKDKNKNESLVGVTAVIEGTTIGAVTDFDGTFTIEGVAPGTYNVRFSYISFTPLIVEKIVVEKNKTTIVNAEMEEQSLEMEGVEVVAQRRSNTEVAMISSIKASSVITNGISSQQILKTQDRDASEVVKRIPGITITDDRFINVRGLSSRYNNVWINNAAAPSSETDLRAFSFDMIPSAMIDNITIYKTPAPELPADFSGGFVKISTKNMPDKNSISFSYSSSYNDGTTFNDFYTYKGGKTDWLGYDDGTRALPDGFPANLQKLKQAKTLEEDKENKAIFQELGRAMNKNWTAYPVTAIPDQRIGLNVNSRFNLFNIKCGNVTALNYGNTRDYNDVFNASYNSYNFLDDSVNPEFKFVDDVYVNKIRIGVMHNWAFFLGKGHKIEFRNLFNQISNDRTTLRRGFEFYSSQNMRSYEYTFSSRSIYTGQLAGEHAFNNRNTVIDWNVGTGTASKNMPDTKRLTQFLVVDSNLYGYGRYSTAFLPNANMKYAGRLFLETAENVYNGSANLTQKFMIGEFKPEVKAGFFYERKYREFSVRNIGYVISDYSKYNTRIAFQSLDSLFRDENINDSTGIRIDEATNKSDAYVGLNRLYAGYLGFKLPFTRWMTLYTGVRVESNSQVLNSHDNANSEPVYVFNDTIDYFPSANLMFGITEQHIIRLSYGKTINRPEFREIAPFAFYEFDVNAVFSGNPELMNAIVHNYDLRYEFYPSARETFTFGVFYKEFIHPIEVQYKFTGSGLEYTYHNALAADNYGAEIEMRKSLSFISPLKDFLLVTNAAIIQSMLEFGPNSLEHDRPMYGQSPYIVNIGLFYDNPDIGLMSSLLYNIIGERIETVGIPAQNPREDIPNVFEMPRHSLDFALSKKFLKHYELNFGVKDILADDYRLQQTVKNTGPAGNNETIQYVKKYIPGRYFTMGFKVTF